MGFQHQKLSTGLENNQTEITTPPEKYTLNNCFAISRVLQQQHSHLLLKWPVLPP